jgi:RNA methyltransferase, TrmH family
MVKLVYTRDLKSLGTSKGHAGSSPAPGTNPSNLPIASMQRLSSRQNAHLKLASKLADSARERSKAGKLLLDGTRLIRAYVDQFGFNEVLLLLSEAGAARNDVVELSGAANPRNVYLLADDLFAEITQVETPEGITAIARIPHVSSAPKDDFRVLIDGVQDPGNLGGLLRTAAAAGATSAHLTKGCADAWSPKSLRGGMGAQFVLPVRERVELGTAVVGFRGSIIATSPRGEQSIHDIDLTGPVALIFGSEGRGLGEEGQALATHLVHIPMAGKIESLNVAAAAAICCFERQRQISGKNGR